MFSHIIYLAKTDSTNNYIKRNLKNLKNKTVVWAKQQTSGRGKGLRKWQSTTGSLCFSLLLHLPSNTANNITKENQIEKPPLTEWPAITTQLTAVAVCWALNAIGLYPSIKWPNDIVFGNLKAAGILIDLVSLKNIDKHSSHALIIGIGINALQSNSQLKEIHAYILQETIDDKNKKILPTSLLSQLEVSQQLLKTSNKNKFTKKNINLLLGKYLVYNIVKHINILFLQLNNTATNKQTETKKPLLLWNNYWATHSLLIGKKITLNKTVLKNAHLSSNNIDTQQNIIVRIIGLDENGFMLVKPPNTNIVKIPLSLLWIIR